jgi:hypothetical protein
LQKSGRPRSREQAPRADSDRYLGRPRAQANPFAPFLQKRRLTAAVSMDARFVLSGFCVGAQTVFIGVLDSTACIANFRKLGPEQKLLAHFGKTGTAIFLIQKIE